MKKFIIYLILCITLCIPQSCSVNSSEGKVVGYITHFQNEGVFWKSYEVQVNRSQTGMTSTAEEYHLSIDNDNPNPEVVAILDSAAQLGWKLEVMYYQRFGINCMNNRGSTNSFIRSVKILDKNPNSFLQKKE